MRSGHTHTRTNAHTHTRGVKFVLQIYCEETTRSIILHITSAYSHHLKYCAECTEAMETKRNTPRVEATVRFFSGGQIASSVSSEVFGRHVAHMTYRVSESTSAMIRHSPYRRCHVNVRHLPGTVRKQHL